MEELAYKEVYSEIDYNRSNMQHSLPPGMPASCHVNCLYVLLVAQLFNPGKLARYIFSTHSALAYMIREFSSSILI